VTKPYSARELVARIRAVLRPPRRREAPVDGGLAAGPVRMDVERPRRLGDGAPSRCRSREFDLLELLLRNAGRCSDRSS
jgi:two-component system response regulator RegX3